MADAVVFLDIDGVLNTPAFVSAALATRPPVVAWSMETARATLDPERVARLQALCDRTGAAIVIVSGWRRWASADQIAEALRCAGLTAPVLGCVGGVKLSGDLRRDATLDWLQQHPEIRRWVVIDDTLDHWRGPSGRMTAWISRAIVCPRDGLTDADAERAVAILGGV